MTTLPARELSPIAGQPQDAERWLPIADYEGLYEVSDLGRVRSVQRVVRRSDGQLLTVRARIMKQQVALRGSGVPGHYVVTLSRENRQQTRPVHRLVLTAFKGFPAEGMQGCHNDGNPKNNRLENLRWDTASSNTLDSVKHGTHPWARQTHCPQGHPYSPENTTIGTRGWRRCRACLRARAADYKRRVGLVKQ